MAPGSASSSATTKTAAATSPSPACPPLAERRHHLAHGPLIHLERGDASYIVKVDRLGGMHLEVRLPAGEELAEDEYRSAFREMFDDIGVPPERVADFEFDYSSGNW